MTNEQAIEIIRNEYKCVDSECDIERSCGKCPYMIPTKEPILQAYEMAIKALSSWEKYSDKLWKKAYERGKTEALSQEPTDIDLDTKLMIIEANVNGFAQGLKESSKLEPCDDAISRKLAIRAIKNLYPDIPRVDFNGAKRKWADKYAQYIECERLIEQLPSVTQKGDVKNV